MEITIPSIVPRDYQLPFFKAMDNGCKRAVLRWARRHGKDEVCLALIAMSVIKKVGNYWLLLPEKEQARKAIWNGVNPHTGKKRLDEAFHPALRKSTDKQSMYIEFINGSTFQLLGSDSYDSHVGASPVGIVFSEYALSNPSAWDYFRPMLLENGGWAVFNSTVRGENHFWQLGEFAKKEDGWFFSQINADQSGVFTGLQLEAELRELIATRGEDEGRAIFQQEYFNDPNAAIPGAYYGKWMSAAFAEGRICSVPYEPTAPVITAWDIGINDDNCIWFIQVVGREVRAIDYYACNNQSMGHYVNLIKSKPYAYHEHLLPHDAIQREKGSGKTLEKVINELGLNNTRVIPRTPTLQKQIEDVRNMLPKVWFNESTTVSGRACLTNYHREWDDNKKVFKDQPCHDWASHGASAFATFCQGYKPVRERPQGLQFANNDFSL